MASLSGALDMTASLRSGAINDPSGVFRNIFGSLEEMENSEEDLMAVAGRLKESGKPLPKVYIWCGTEDFLYSQNCTARARLQELGYDLTYEESPGDHQWKYWDEKIQRVLEWLPL